MLNKFTATTPIHAVKEEQFFRSVALQRENGFTVQFLSGLEEDGILPLIERLVGRSGLLVTTPTVARLYGETLTLQLKQQDVHLAMIVLACNETTKTLAQVEQICVHAYQQGLDRQSVLIALGGGVCSDLVTMAASWIRRGISTIRLPTTLVGQVDAAIGIKGAVNFLGKKNSLGCFYPAEAVFIDPNFLKTLSNRHLHAGFAEILKVALVCEVDLFELIERIGPSLIFTHFDSHTVERKRFLWLAITRMLEQLETNFYEDQGFQRLVDFGHIFSPLIETRSDYAISHGEAVAIDMAYSCVLSRQLGLLSKCDLERILSTYQSLGLPINTHLLDEDLVERALIESRAHRGGGTAGHLVLPIRIGQAIFLADEGRVGTRDFRAALVDLKTFGNTNGRLSNPDNKTMCLTQNELLDKPCLVFDVGGTHLRCGYYDPITRTIVNIVREETPNHYNRQYVSRARLYELLLLTMHEMADKVLGAVTPGRVCIAFPGPVDVNGHIIAAPTIWAGGPHEPIDMINDLRHFWPASRIEILNDVVAAGYRYCQNQTTDHFCIVTVSSGIGNKVFIDGKPYLGQSSRGGELGHTLVDLSPNAALCECGGRGHLGGIASGRGTLEHVRRRAVASPEIFRESAISMLSKEPHAITNSQIVIAYHHLDPFVTQCVRETAQPLANALATIHTSLGLERFIIIGGFALAMGDLYRRQLVELASSCCWSIGQDWERMIELGEADDLSGVIGAGRYACEFAL